MTAPEVDPRSQTAQWVSPLCSAWARLGDIPQRRLDAITIGDSDEWERLLWRASERLFWASGMQYRGAGGARTVHLRIDHSSPVSWPRDRASWGDSINGVPIDARSVLAHNPREPRSLWLPDPDVTAVEEVLVDGEVLAPADYRLELEGVLTRVTAGRCGGGWPLHDGAVEVRYLYGRTPPRGGVSAAADLAVEYGRQLAGLTSELPDRVLTVTREGVTWTYADPAEALKHGLTGIQRIDDWVRSVNPYLRSGEAEVISPDVVRAR